jgi:hypothetical protein
MLNTCLQKVRESLIPRSEKKICPSPQPLTNTHRSSRRPLPTVQMSASFQAADSHSCECLRFIPLDSSRCYFPPLKSSNTSCRPHAAMLSVLLTTPAPDLLPDSTPDPWARPLALSPTAWRTTRGWRPPTQMLSESSDRRETVPFPELSLELLLLLPYVYVPAVSRKEIHTCRSTVLCSPCLQ